MHRAVVIIAVLSLWVEYSTVHVVNVGTRWYYGEKIFKSRGWMNLTNRKINNHQSRPVFESWTIISLSLMDMVASSPEDHSMRVLPNVQESETCSSFAKRSIAPAQNSCLHQSAFQASKHPNTFQPIDEIIQTIVLNPKARSCHP